MITNKQNAKSHLKVLKRGNNKMAKKNKFDELHALKVITTSSKQKKEKSKKEDSGIIGVKFDEARSKTYYYKSRKKHNVGERISVNTEKNNKGTHVTVVSANAEKPKVKKIKEID